MHSYFLAADIFLENEFGEILLLHRKKEKDILGGYYNGIGGKFDAFETPKEAVLREMKEEISVTHIQDLALKVILTVHDRYGYWTIFCYTGKVKKEDVKTDIAIEEGTLEWVKKENFSSKNLVPDLQEWYLKLFEEGVSYVKVEYDEEYGMRKFKVES